MLNILKWSAIGAVAVFVCYHYWPRETVKAGHKIANTTMSAAKAGYTEARK